MVKLETWLRERGLLNPSRRLMASVSGGADSMVLLRLLVELRDEVGADEFPALLAGHVNHGIRGGEADRDAYFVRRVSARWGVPCVVQETDARARATAGRLSPEAAARAVRYEAYRGWAHELELDAILLAHHREDQAETVLLQTLRGGGLRGLSGMPAERALAGGGAGATRIGRPLLDWSRSDLLRFRRDRSLEFVTDSTNADEGVPRNRLRRRILPELEEVRPGAVGSLCRVAAVSRRVADDLRALGKRAFSESLLEAGEGWRAFGAALLGSWPPSVVREVLLLALSDVARRASTGSPSESPSSSDSTGRFPLRTLDTITGWLQDGGGSNRRSVQLPCGVGVELRYKKLWVLAQLPNDGVRRAPAFLREPGDFCRWGGWELQLGVLRPRGVPPGAAGGGCVPRDREVDDAWISETFDADVLLGAGAVEVRSRRQGELFRPLGAPGRKKLKEFLRASQVPPVLRHQVPLVVAGGVIVWVVGHRIAHEARVSSTTRQVVTLRARMASGEGG